MSKMYRFSLRGSGNCCAAGKVVCCATELDGGVTLELLFPVLEASASLEDFVFVGWLTLELGGSSCGRATIIHDIKSKTSSIKRTSYCL
jgi:hypothetical protein